MMSTELATTTVTNKLPAIVRAPITLDYVEALKAYADVLFKGGLCPKSKDQAARPETVAAILEVGKDIGLPATQALANIRITNGRPAIFGDAALALIRASGLLEDFEETFEGEPYADDYTAVCRVKRKGAARDRVERFSVADAKRAGLWDNAGPWKTAPKRMLMFRARGFVTRDEFGDVLLGLIFAEEANDIGGPGGEVVGPVTVTVAQVVPPLADPPKALPEVKKPAVTTREDLLVRLAELRDLLFTSRSISDAKSDDAKRTWSEALAPFGVASAKDLTDEKLAELVETLRKEHDPF